VGTKKGKEKTGRVSERYTLNTGWGQGLGHLRKRSLFPAIRRKPLAGTFKEEISQVDEVFEKLIQEVCMGGLPGEIRTVSGVIKKYKPYFRQMIEGFKKTQATRAIATGAYNQAIDDVLTPFK
jgi:hypothetical protein